MNNESSLRTSKTDWARINAMQDEDIDFSDAPEATEEQIARSIFRIGGVPVDRTKQAVHMVLDCSAGLYPTQSSDVKSCIIAGRWQSILRESPFFSQITVKPIPVPGGLANALAPVDDSPGRLRQRLNGRSIVVGRFRTGRSWIGVW